MSNIKTCLLVALSIPIVASQALSQETSVPINGTVQSRCVIQSDTPGTYGNPNAYELSTLNTAGGNNAVVRIDVTLADSYYVNITAPSESNKQELGMTDKYDLTATGSTWFETASTATLGGSRAFPGGNYSALVVAECIAK